MNCGAVIKFFYISLSKYALVDALTVGCMCNMLMFLPLLTWQRNLSGDFWNWSCASRAYI